MHAVVLAGGPLGRDIPLQEKVPRPFWPVLMRPIILQGIQRMVADGVRTLTVCANGRTNLYAEKLPRKVLRLEEIRFNDDALPRGPAGCIKDAAAKLPDGPFFVVNAACWFSDSISSMVEQHRQQGNVLTVFCAHDETTPSGLYLCEKAVLDFIPDVGYCDIKEQLIPRLVANKLKVGCGRLSGLVREVIDTTSYLELHHHVLEETFGGSNGAWGAGYEERAPGIWIAPDAEVASTARLYAPLIIGPRASIGAHAVVVGPGTVGHDAVIDRNAVVFGSAVWPGARVPEKKTVEQAVVAPEESHGLRPIDFLSLEEEGDRVSAEHAGG